MLYITMNPWYSTWWIMDDQKVMATCYTEWMANETYLMLLHKEREYKVQRLQEHLASVADPVTGKVLPMIKRSEVK